MKKKLIEIKNNPLWLIKESSEDRLNRVRTQRPMGTTIEKSKKKYTRKAKHRKRLVDSGNE